MRNKRLNLIHVSDPHFDYLPNFNYGQFVTRLKAKDFSALIVTGDICDGPYASKHLARLANDVKKDIYFVLGNHDYYNTTSEFSQSISASADKDNKLLHYLTESAEPTILRDTSIGGLALVGHDGFYDGLSGKGARSTAQLVDFRSNYDFAGKNKFNVMYDLASNATRQIEDKIVAAAERVKTILVATHVPPFPEAALFNGKPSGEDFLPFYSCSIMGSMLKHFAEAHPDHMIFVLCGHTHSHTSMNISDNLTVFVGGAHIGETSVIREMSL